MNNVTRTLIVIILTTSCTNHSIKQSDIDTLLKIQITSNEKILADAKQFIDDHGKEGFEASRENYKSVLELHEDVNTLIHEFDSESPSHIQLFIEKNIPPEILASFPGFKLSKSKPELAKWQLLNLENIFLREHAVLNYKFDNFDAIILPDKLCVSPKDKISGRVALMGYSTLIHPPMEVNGKNIMVKDGVGHFSISRSEVQGDSLKAVITFPGMAFKTRLMLGN